MPSWNGLGLAVRVAGVKPSNSMVWEAVKLLLLPSKSTQLEVIVAGTYGIKNHVDKLVFVSTGAVGAGYEPSRAKFPAIGRCLHGKAFAVVFAGGGPGK